jgi:hypothetical protein
MLWNLIVTVIYLASFFFTPFVVIDPQKLLPKVREIEFTFDVILILDFIIHFFKAYHSDSEIISDHKQVVINYLSGYFIIDAISTAPGLFTLESMHDVYFLKMFRYFHIKRFFEFINTILVKLRKSVMTSLSKNLIDGITLLVRSVLNFVLLVHIFACIWIGLGTETGDSWISQNPEYSGHSDKYSYSYPASIYFIVTTITTVGYGDFSPNSNIELLYVIVLELLGLAIFSYTLGSIQSFRNDSTSEQILNQK